MRIFQFWPADAIAYSCQYQIEQCKKFPVVGVTTCAAFRHCGRLKQVLTPLISKNPMQDLSSISGPTCFERLLVGMPMYSDDCLDGNLQRISGSAWIPTGRHRMDGRKSDSHKKIDFSNNKNQWSLCNHGRQGQLWNFRLFTKKNIGLHDFNPPHHRAVIWKPDQSDRRGNNGVRNIDDLAQQIWKRWKIAVDVIDLATLSISEQIELMNVCTVHLTPPGGGSFVAIWLPRGATTIRLYPKDYAMEWNFFHYLGYIHIEHVWCQNRTVPLNKVSALVGQAIERYGTFGGNLREHRSADTWREAVMSAETQTMNELRVNVDSRVQSKVHALHERMRKLEQLAEQRKADLASHVQLLKRAQNCYDTPVRVAFSMCSPVLSV